MKKLIAGIAIILGFSGQAFSMECFFGPEGKAMSHINPRVLEAVEGPILADVVINPKNGQLLAMTIEDTRTGTKAFSMGGTNVDPDGVHFTKADINRLTLVVGDINYNLDCNTLHKD